jgi:hypothetical protein
MKRRILEQAVSGSELGVVTDRETERVRRHGTPFNYDALRSALNSRAILLDTQRKTSQ